MQQQESAAPVARVEHLDAVDGGGEDRAVGIEHGFARIGEVGQQREVKIVVAVREVAHFELADEAPGAADTRQQGRDGDQRPGIVRNALSKIHLRQRPRRDDERGDAVHERGGELAGADRGKKNDDDLQPEGDGVHEDVRQHRRHDHDAQRNQRQKIER